MKTLKILSKLHEDVGAKLCKLAKLVSIIGVLAMIVGVVLLPVMVANGEVGGLIGAICAIAGGFIFIVSSMFLYAFGQITDDVHSLTTQSGGGKTAVIVNDLPEL